MEGFEGIEKALNIEGVDNDFTKAIKSVENNIKLIEAKKTDIINQSKVPVMFRDQEFIETELRSLIMSARTIMYKVEQDIKIGADARKVEVYAKLIESIGKQYASLIELNKNIFDAQIQTNQFDITNLGHNKISLSSEQLLDMINKAGENSQMNKVDAKFEIKEEYIPNLKNQDNK